MRGLILPVAAISLLAGCSSVYQPNSPDVAYSSDSTSSRSLQVPPDLTDVSDGEQFIIPGTGGGTASRNTLLPVFESVRYVRNGEQSWLEIDQPPEDIWPRLLEFVRQQKYRVDQTEPVAGVISTQWRPSATAQGGGLLKNLIGGDEAFTRIAFRLERDDDGTRLFARSQAASEELAKAPAEVAWPASAHAPEATSTLLSRLLVFLGVDEQKTKGILSEAQARDILQDAALQTTSAGSQLVVHKGYLSSFRAVSAALGTLEYDIKSSDDSVGRIEATSDAQPALIVLVAPVHVSAVRVSLQDGEGRQLPLETQRKVLEALREHLA